MENKYKVIISNDSIAWYEENTNILHREEGPALELSNGTKKWYKHGLCHRDDGPAVEYPSGSKFWYQYGVLHRVGAPAIIWTETKLETSESWYQHGKLHRLDGPATVDHQRNKMWYKDGKLHREDGPAIEWHDGAKSYYLNDLKYSKKDYQDIISKSFVNKVIEIDGVKYKLTKRFS